MKLFSCILITSLLFQLWMPWWVIMALPFLFCLWLGRTAKQAFTVSFLAIFLLWLGASLFIHIRSGGLLSERVSVLLYMNSPLLLILVTSLTGALAAGIAGWAGIESKRLLRNFSG